jgi:hypothetical protein
MHRRPRAEYLAQYLSAETDVETSTFVAPSRREYAKVLE